MTKCSECGRKVVEYIGYYPYWIKLYNMAEFLYNEEQITLQTYNSIVDSLTYIKSAVEDADDKLEENKLSENEKL
jgi:hypothetical protein